MGQNGVIDFRVETRAPQLAAAIRVAGDPDEIEATMDSIEARVMSALEAQGVAPVGPSYWRYYEMSDTCFDYEVGFPIDQAVEETGGIQLTSLPGGEIAVLTYRGHPDQTPDLYEAMEAWMEENDRSPRDVPWEVYKSLPHDESENWDDAVTELHYPSK